ncbi:MAG: hypothetical protein RSC07_01325 [Mucinivorans sp.]
MKKILLCALVAVSLLSCKKEEQGSEKPFRIKYVAFMQPTMEVRVKATENIISYPIEYKIYGDQQAHVVYGQTPGYGGSINYQETTAIENVHFVPYNDNPNEVLESIGLNQFKTKIRIYPERIKEKLTLTLERRDHKVYDVPGRYNKMTIIFIPE